MDNPNAVKSHRLRLTNPQLRRSGEKDLGDWGSCGHLEHRGSLQRETGQLGLHVLCWKRLGAYPMERENQEEGQNTMESKIQEKGMRELSGEVSWDYILRSTFMRLSEKMSTKHREGSIRKGQSEPESVEKDSESDKLSQDQQLVIEVSGKEEVCSLLNGWVFECSQDISNHSLPSLSHDLILGPAGHLHTLGLGKVISWTQELQISSEASALLRSSPALVFDPVLPDREGMLGIAWWVTGRLRPVPKGAGEPRDTRHCSAECPRHSSEHICRQLKVLGKIRTAVGSAQLLMAQKFYQFRELCEENLNPNAHPRPTSQDLAGFWDMLQLSIENISMKFDELHQLKANNWKQMDPLDKKERRAPPPVPKKPAKGPAPLIRERSLESSQRQEARKRLMAAKRAASVRQNSATESAESIEIYIPEAQTRL
ncbi:hypothetical protein P7K49_028346 [Saguinus oedipus]|uniref:DLG associated protein 1 n=1 Tax=Saguinus oedipus TaxID=9490 RepID=A0ABQ9UC13_SAGOE|nr:hypothetical protein P7K49_028346 [Saguinus oedipus]